MSKLGRYFLCTSLFGLAGCSSHKSIKKLTIARNRVTIPATIPITPPLNVWIHGTRFIRRPLFHSFFRGTPGLRLARELASDYYLRKVVQTLCWTAPEQFPLDTFYLFGWSGKLGVQEHQDAARILFDELKRVSNEYKNTYGTAPFIRLITHSHGGSVALNLVKIKETEGKPFTINELVLLACPVQEATRKYIEDDLFDHTIALYSSLDMIQVLAPQVVYNVFRTKKGHMRSRLNWPPFSYRRFQPHPRLAQVKIKINGRALFHTEFTHKRFISLLPHIIHVMNTWQKYNTIPHSTHLLCVYTQPINAFNLAIPVLV